MNDSNEVESSDIKEPNKRQQRAIIEIQPGWSFWQRTLASIVNAIPVYLWAIVTFYLLKRFESNPELVAYGDAYLNLIVRATAYHILSLVAGISLISWLNPYFHPRHLMQGSRDDKYVCVIYWFAVIIGLSIVISRIG